MRKGGMRERREEDGGKEGGMREIETERKTGNRQTDLFFWFIQVIQQKKIWVLKKHAN